MSTHIFILSGGAGTRLWPLSLPDAPKQFHDLTGEGVPLLISTIRRLAGLGEISVVTTAHLVPATHALLQEHQETVRILEEPEAKNTAAAIAYCVAQVQKEDSEGIACFFPADHFIGDVAAFRVAVAQAITAAQTRATMVTMGVTPTFPATGYGYLLLDAQQEDGSIPVQRFQEKPDVATAQQLLDGGHALWNSGVVVGPVAQLAHAFAHHTPELWAALSTATTPAALAHAYAALPCVSMDVAVMERLDHLLCIPLTAGWSDVGSWEEVATRIGRTPDVALDSAGTLAIGVEKKVAVINAPDLLIIETPDALLIVRRGDGQRVRELVKTSLLALLLVVGGMIGAPVVAHAAGTLSDLVITDTHGATHTLVAFPDNPDASVLGLAAADLGHDGVEEIVVGAGPGVEPLVRVLRQDGSMIGEFLAYAPGMSAGVDVAVCDLAGDGTPEIITGVGDGGGAHVRIFDAWGQWTGVHFFAAEGAQGGIRVACGERATDGTHTIVTESGAIDAPVTRVFSRTGTLRSATPHTAPAPRTPVLSMQRGTIARTDTLAHRVRVDLSQQRLIAFEYGIPVRSFLVSTGVRNYPTPLGETTISAKLPVHDYSWFYGRNDPRNYSLPNVQWNLRFRPHYYLHSAYWHHNFGHVMSHGCVNISIPNAAWLYAWATVGDVVTIVP